MQANKRISPTFILSVFLSLMLDEYSMLQSLLTTNASRKSHFLEQSFKTEKFMSIETAFNKLHINQKKISRSESVKYLGVWFDDKLNWSAHVQKLSLQLARCCNMLYHIRDFVNAHALGMLHYSFVYSRLTYGITARDTAAKTNFVRLKSN